MIQQENIIFSCDDFLVVNKPVGLSVQCEGEYPGCIALLKQFLGAEQLHPVHRLDKVTSGLLLVAKHKESNRVLSQLFQRGQVSKYYYALSSKRPSKKQGSIIGDMKAARSGSWKLLRSKSNPAVTQFFSSGLSEGVRLFVLKPQTGKTHQLRVALKSLGAPILGDLRYGAQDADRVYLHAAALSFDYGGSNFSFHQLPNSGCHFVSTTTCKRFAELGHPSAQPWPNLNVKVN